MADWWDKTLQDPRFQQLDAAGKRAFASELFSRLKVPPEEQQKRLAQLDAPAGEGHPYLALGARIATPMLGFMAGGPLGAAAGGAAGEYAAERLEGRPEISPKEVALQAGLAAIPGLKPAQSVLSGAAKWGLHGAAVSALGTTGLSLVQRKELPSKEELKTAALWGAGLGGVSGGAFGRTGAKAVAPALKAAEEAAPTVVPKVAGKTAEELVEEGTKIRLHGEAEPRPRIEGEGPFTKARREDVAYIDKHPGPFQPLLHEIAADANQFDVQRRGRISLKRVSESSRSTSSGRSKPCDLAPSCRQQTPSSGHGRPPSSCGK